MFHAIFEWIQNIICFLIILSAVLEVLPGKQYQRYVRFYTGIVFLLLVVSPVFQLFGAGDIFEKKLEQKEYEQMIRKTEQKEQYFQTEDFLGILSDIENDTVGNVISEEEKESYSEQKSDIRINVEDIRIGDENQIISETDDERE